MIDDTRAKQAVRLSTQIICEMLIKRRLCPLLLEKSIERAIEICRKSGKDIEAHRKELEVAKTLATTPAINADVIIFRFFRAIPMTKRSKKKLLETLDKYRPENTKKWRIIPRKQQISLECSDQAIRHLQVILLTIKQSDTI